MVEKMEFQEFSKRYGFSDKRQTLINIIDRETRRIARQEGQLRCVVFGSMINSRKLEPDDIDAIISVSSNRMPRDWLFSTEIWHAFPVRMTPPNPPADAETMIECFNQNLAEDFVIQPKDCIELIF